MYERTGYLVQKKFREYLLPTIMTSLAMSLASVVDAAIVGNLLGEKALAAVGLCAPVIFCINLIYMLFGVGGMTFSSIARGKREQKRFCQAFTVSIAGGLVVMAIFVIVMLLIMEPVTTALAGGDKELAALAASYLRPLVFTGPAIMFSSGISLFMRSDGFPKRSAVVVLVANGVNLIFDYTLIRFLNTGIMGAGLSTTLGYVAGGVLVIPYLLNKNRAYRFLWPGKDFVSVLADILRLGAPKGFTQITSMGRSLILNTIIIRYIGSAGMSVMSALINVVMICNIFVGGTCDSLLPVAGTLYGEEDYYGVRQTLKSARTVLTMACTALMLVFLLGSEFVGGMFGLNSPEVKAVWLPAIRIFVLYVPLYAAVVTLQNFYNTTGREKLASMIAILDGFVFICSFALLFVQIRPQFLWLCYPAGSAATLLVIFLMGIRIRKKEKVQGIFLIREKSDASLLWDFTIEGTEEQAVGISSRVVAFGREHQLDSVWINHLGVLLEEMAVATAHYAHKENPGMIDIKILLKDNRLMVRFRDDGAAFNPVEYVSDSDNKRIVTDGIALIKKLADEVEYDRQLGFNITVMSIKYEK